MSEGDRDITKENREDKILVNEVIELIDKAVIAISMMTQTKKVTEFTDTELADVEIQDQPTVDLCEWIFFEEICFYKQR